MKWLRTGIISAANRQLQIPASDRCCSLAAKQHYNGFAAKCLSNGDVFARLFKLSKPIATDILRCCQGRRKGLLKCVCVGGGEVMDMSVLISSLTL